MNNAAIIFIAFGLAMDALAVSITSGIAIKSLKVGNALKIALFFGLFQAMMPVVGWLAGLSLKDLITGIDHWIAFGLLGFIGCRMIYESLKMDADREEVNPLNVSALLMLSVATSIDALAVGVTFAFLDISVVKPVVAIGCITFSMSFAGVYIGNLLGHFFERKIEIVGGIILIGIGAKVLIEHLA